MTDWTFRPLVYGTIDVFKEQLTTGLDVGMEVRVPYLGFYLTDGTHKVVVDNGINAKYIVDGKAWAGRPAAGGEDWVQKSLDEIGVSTDDVDLLIYTHLHNDHAGNCHLFGKTTHVFQDDEWKELLDPLPSMRIRGDFDRSLIPQLEALKCMRVDGDVEILDGLKLIKTPGHTAGSQCILVNTKNGVYNLAGDTIHVAPIAFPQMEEWIMMDGETRKITPAPLTWGPAVPSSLVYDHYAWYKSIYRIKAELRDPSFLIPGHETSIVGKTFG